MQNKDKGDGIEDSPLDMLLVILLDGASKEVVMPSSLSFSVFSFSLRSSLLTWLGVINFYLYRSFNNQNYKRNINFNIIPLKAIN